MKQWSMQSLTIRLALSFSVLSFFVLLAVSLASVYAVNRHFIALDQDSLSERFTRLTTAVKDVADQRELEKFLLRKDGPLAEHRDESVHITGQDGAPLSAIAHGSPPFPDASIQLEMERRFPRPVSWRVGNAAYRGIRGPLETDHAGRPRRYATIVLDISSHESFLRAFARSMAGIAVVSTLLMGALGWVATRRALLPLRTMAAEALDMTANRLDHHLSTISGPLELMELTRTLNDMLDSVVTRLRPKEKYT